MEGRMSADSPVLVGIRSFSRIVSRDPKQIRRWGERGLFDAAQAPDGRIDVRKARAWLALFHEDPAELVLLIDAFLVAPEIAAAQSVAALRTVIDAAVSDQFGGPTRGTGHEA
jgi:hypothetical protein